MEVVCQFFRTVKVVYVDIRLVGGSVSVILGPGAHNDGDHVMTARKNAKNVDCLGKKCNTIWPSHSVVIVFNFLTKYNKIKRMIIFI